MTFRLAVLTAVLMLGIAPAALAQASASAATEPAESVPVANSGIDAKKLPINFQRLQREFKQATSQQTGSGLNLQYFIEVFAPAPQLVVFTREDNLRYGPVPYGAPTHRDMLYMLTPQAHRGSLYALPLFRLPSTKGK